MARGYRQAQAERDRAEDFIEQARAEVKKPGEAAHLGYWDGGTLEVDEGDVVETTTGRRYLVTAARRTGGKDPHWELETVVMDPADPNPEGCSVHGLRWFPRGRRA